MSAPFGALGCHVLVYPLLVRERRMDWRERAERMPRWTSPSEAAELSDDDGLARIFNDLARDDGALTE